jgi:hypothetical protein
MRPGLPHESEGARFHAAEPKRMIEELRHYVATPGKLDALVKRFQNDTKPLFDRHKISVTAFWTVREPADTLYYVWRFEDEAAMKAAWKAFLADPEWAAVREATERDGPIVASLKSMVLDRVDGICT